MCAAWKIEYRTVYFVDIAVTFTGDCIGSGKRTEERILYLTIQTAQTY